MKYFLSLLFIIFMLAGCKGEEQTIHIGYEAWIGYQPLLIAKEKKFFEQEGVKVQLHYFSSFNDLVRAYSEGKVDFIFVTTTEALLIAERGEKIKIVSVVDYSNGADAIVAQKSIPSVSDLKGKKISLETKTVSHFLLLKALEKYNLKQDEVTLINVDGPESINLFKNQSVDAAVTWAPYVAQLEKANGHAIFTSRETPGEIIDVMAIKQSLIANDPKAVMKIITAYFKTVEWLNNNLSEASQMIGRTYTGGSAEFLKDLQGVQLTGLKENLAAFGTPQTQGQLYSSTRKFMSFLLNQKVIKKEVDVNELIDPTFIWKYSKQHDATHSQ